ncbi:hypothetical protein KSS87_019603 [Heliosperma pusillum]|nr:hypothetical protein KSS87_019603 [Heliosperma pusillum]
MSFGSRGGNGMEWMVKLGVRLHNLESRTTRYPRGLFEIDLRLGLGVEVGGEDLRLGLGVEVGGYSASGYGVQKRHPDKGFHMRLSFRSLI